MYPMLREDISFMIRKSKNSDKLRYYIKNGDEDEFEISRILYNALRKADGTKPLELLDRGKKNIPKLKKDHLIHTSRIVHLGGPLFGFILFPIGGSIRKFKWLFRLLNAALPIFSVLSFVIGVLFMLLHNANDSVDENYEIIYWLQYLLIWLSIMFHEIGHMNAGIAYGYKVCSVGVLLLTFFPLGAYVSYNENLNYNKSLTAKEKIQFSLSGIESNLLIAGVLLLLSFVVNNDLSHTLISVANANIIMAILNSLPALGLDGEKALSALLDVESIFIVALEWMLF